MRSGPSTRGCRRARSSCALGRRRPGARTISVVSPEAPGAVAASSPAFAAALASTTRSGPRPASQPAHSSATQALPGTYQVQSASEWMPKTTTMQSMLSMATRSAEYGAARPSTVNRRHAG